MVAPPTFFGMPAGRMIRTMDVKLKPDSESALRKLAERSGVTPERYAAETLDAHVGTYDQWFVKAVQKGLDDVAAGRVASLEDLKHEDEARRERLKELIRSK